MTWNDLRKGRHSEVGRAYLLTAVTRDRQPIFADWRTGRVVVRELARLAAEGQADSLCFVVMPDHVHWLVALQGGSLAGLMQHFKGRTARALGGAVWQPGFHDHALRTEEDLPTLARYIVANPVRAGLVARVGDYPLWDAVWL